MLNFFALVIEKRFEIRSFTKKTCEIALVPNEPTT